MFCNRNRSQLSTHNVIKTARDNFGWIVKSLPSVQFFFEDGEDIVLLVT